MKRVIDDTRTGSGYTLGRDGESEGLGDRGNQETIIPPCFLTNSEEAEEDERRKDSSPSSGLQRNDGDRVQHSLGELIDVGVSPVSVIPGDPRVNRR